LSRPKPTRVAVPIEEEEEDLVRKKSCISYENLLDIIKTHQVNADISP